MPAYAVVFERGERNWSPQEIEELIREAIEFHIEGLRLGGELVPEPTSEAQNIRISA
jgi:predicted RNase H-like HicB family nuclease